jgi:hypothetical protein
MTENDQELLDKQLRGIDAAPPGGVLMLAIAAVFFTGMAFGGFLFAYTDEAPLRIAANDIPVATQGAQPPVPAAR